MKRRVLRNHANKKNLRVISATHSLSIATRIGGSSEDGKAKSKLIPVLCDSSFIRAVLLSCPPPPPPTPTAPNNSTSSSSAKGAFRQQVGRHDGRGSPAPAMKPLALVRQLCEDAFSVFDTEEMKKKKRYGGSRHNGPGAFVLYYLPETRRALDRHLSTPTATDSNKEAKDGETKQRGKGKSKKEKHSFTAAAVGDMLSGMRKVRIAGAPEDRNEAKAIQALVQQSGGSPRALASSGGPPASSLLPLLFIATQSHDVRRLLPGSTPLLRFTQKPPSVWVEQNDVYLSQYSREGAASVPETAKGSSTLSRADRAFVAFITSGGGSGGAKPLSREALLAAARGTVATGQGPAPAAAAGSGVSDTTAEGGGSVPAERPRPKKRRAAHSPNPLSAKKKQKREVFRVE